MKHYQAQIAATLLATSFAFVGCGKKKENKNHAAPKPSVEITAVETSGAGMKTLKFQSDLEGVTYECKVQTSNTVGTWESCSESGYQLTVAQDGPVIFSVRAKKDGQVSEEITKIIAAAEQVDPTPEAPAAEEPVQQEPFQAIISEKANPSAINEAQNASTIYINFTAKGADLSLVSFECLVGDDSQNYGAQNNGQQGQINNGQQGQLNNGQQGQVNNGQQGQAPVSNWQQCQSPIQLERSVAGSFPTLKVRPRNNQTGEYGQADVIQFPQSNIPVQAAVSEMLLGREYKFVVPQGMHVTEYASNANQNGVIDGYRIRTESDGNYVGNTRCEASFEDDFLAISPSGQPLRYCNFTPRDDVYKFMTDVRWANSHLALGTDQERVAENPYNNEHIIINLFGADPEFKRNKTRFYDLCKNALGGRVETVDRPITMLRNFWGERVRVSFYMCSTLLNVRQPGGFVKAEVFRVGAFFVTDQDLDFPGSLFDPRCDCSYDYPHLLEVVYIARANSTNETPGFFAQYAQSKFEGNLFPANYRTVGF